MPERELVHREIGGEDRAAREVGQALLGAKRELTALERRQRRRLLGGLGGLPFFVSAVAPPKERHG